MNHHHHYSKQSSLTRCGISSLSLSGLSIASDESSSSSSSSSIQHPNACHDTSITSNNGAGSCGGGMQRSTLRRGWGSAACNNLSALGQYEEQQAHQASHYDATLSHSSMTPCTSAWEERMMGDDIHQYQPQYQQQQLLTTSSRFSMDTTGDDWGYFVDGNLPSSVPIVW
jgi:hypothetical protein